MATIEKARPGAGGLLAHILEEAPFFVGVLSLAAFQFGADPLLADLSNPALAAALFAWLFLAMLWAAFGVVRHADALADLLGEPYGTLILTLAVIGIEVSLISAIMLTGDAAPTLARDTMFAVVMITLGAGVGLALLIGGIRHHAQAYSLEGARAFLIVLLPAATFAMVLPVFTRSTDAPTYAPAQAVFFAIVTALLYAVFLAIQTVRHRGWFEQPPIGDGKAIADHQPHGTVRSVPYHAILLVLTLLPIVLLSKRLAKVVDHGLLVLGAPAALGGVVIALLILAPEGLSALKAARDNHLQRSVNLLLGSAVATIGLTVPAVLAISLITGAPVVLGLDPVSLVLLVVTLVACLLTFGGTRTNVLNGAVHLVLFLAWLMLIFRP